MTICPSCRIEHKGEGIPPSLKDRLKECAECYKIAKKKSDASWRARNKFKMREYKRNQRKANPIKTAKEWVERKIRWKIKKALRKAQKTI